MDDELQETITSLIDLAEYRLDTAADTQVALFEDLCRLWAEIARQELDDRLKRSRDLGRGDA